MPLDPQAQYVLEQLDSLGLPPNHTVSPEQARINGQMRARAAGPEVAKVEDRLIPGLGPEIPARIYTPEGPGPFPVLVWFHPLNIGERDQVSTLGEPASLQLTIHLCAS